MYVYGAPVKVVTDHKPLITLYGNPGAKLHLQLERRAMRLCPTNLLLLLTGKWYILTTKCGQDQSLEFEAIQPYSRVGNELTVTQDGLVLRGTRIAVPASLQHVIIQLVHEGHQGINKTKVLPTQKVWFPRIDTVVAMLLEECTACKTTYDPKRREPLVMSDLPSEMVSPLRRFLWTITLRSVRTVIPVFDKIFSSRRIPDNPKTVNGTPFHSEEFKRFAVNQGFRQWVMSYSPEANGVAERFMRTTGKVYKFGAQESQGKSTSSVHKNHRESLQVRCTRITGKVYKFGAQESQGKSTSSVHKNHRESLQVRCTRITGKIYKFGAQESQGKSTSSVHKNHRESLQVRCTRITGKVYKFGAQESQGKSTSSVHKNHRESLQVRCTRITGKVYKFGAQESQGKSTSSVHKNHRESLQVRCTRITGKVYKFGAQESQGKSTSSVHK